MYIYIYLYGGDDDHDHDDHDDDDDDVVVVDDDDLPEMIGKRPISSHLLVWFQLNKLLLLQRHLPVVFPKKRDTLKSSLLIDFPL